MDVHVAFIDDKKALTKMSELLDRDDLKGSNNIPWVGTPAVLTTKQELLKLMMPALVAVQNQQELSAAVQRSLEAFVYGGIAVDESQLQDVSPLQSVTHSYPGSS